MTTRCAVLGDPIAHSLSPVLHRTAYDALGLDWSYDAVKVPAGTLQEFLAGLDDRWRGLSLTMPLKREVLPALSSRDPWVVATGACNTVVLEPDGSRHGSNTDVTGAMVALRAVSGELGEAVVLGGGATATSLLVALAERGLQRATLAVRNPETAAETVQRVTAHRGAPKVAVITIDELCVAPPGADIALSTVPVAAQREAVVEALTSAPVVFEALYDPWPTPLAAAAEQAGRHLITGLDLLVAQAVNQVALMTGCSDVPAETMRAAAEAILAARS